MENQTRFDLNAAIANWQQELAAQSNLTPEVRRELETHLCDSIADLRQCGLNDEESFWLARRRVGQPQHLSEEFERAMKTRDTSFWNRPLAFAAWLIFVVSFFLPSYHDLRGYQCALGQDWFWSQAIHGDWPSIHYMLLTLANLLMLASPFLLPGLARDARSLKWLRYSTFAALILVWSFILLFFSNHADRVEMKIGCYVWGVSFALLYLSILLQPNDTMERNGLQRATSHV